MIKNIPKYLLKVTIFGFFLVMFFPSLHFSQIQNIRFEHLTYDDGLSHPYVRSILQDNQGFMWFGTYDGLNKYDGYQFTIYRHDDKDSSSIISNVIRCLYKDNQGNLWIGTIGGACIYDRDHDVFIDYNKHFQFDLSSFDILSIFIDSQDNLWIGTSDQGLFFVNLKNQQHIHYVHRGDDSGSISSNSIRQIFEDSRGHVWIATVNGGVNLFDRDTTTFTHFQHQSNNSNSIIGNDVFAIVEDIEGNLWFACYDDGLSCIHVDEADSHSFSNYQHDPQNSRGLCNNSVRVLCPDKDGGIWIGTEEGGLDYLCNDKKTFIHYENDLSNPKSLNNNSIYALFQGKTGDLWIGTYEGGVNIFYRLNQAFQTYHTIKDDAKSLSCNAVWEFCEDHTGNIWIATDGGGLNQFDPATSYFKHYNSKNSNLNVDAVLTVYVDSQNDIWIGTWNGGFSLFNRRTKSFTTYTNKNSDLSNNNVFDITEDQDGCLWLATHHGLNKYNKNDHSFTVYTSENSGLISNYLEVIQRDMKGNILIGSVYGFFIFDPETETFINYTHHPEDANSISNNFVNSIFEEDSSIIWIATNEGLNKLNRQTNQIVRYYKTDGLPNDLIFGIEKDDRGFLWISTNGGISRFDPKTETFKNYTKEDGLQGNLFIKKSHYRSRNGKIYFGGVNGFNILDPEDVTDNQTIPPIVITDFEIFNKPIKNGSEGSPLKKHIGQTDEIVLSYKQTVFSFRFAALNYIISSKNQYAYMLEGFDKEWNYVGTQRMATYTNIDPGKYVFRVKGSNNDGVWNEEGASIKIRITPPFWHTLWFRLLACIVLIASLLTGYKIRTATIRHRTRELEKHIKERTAQLENINQELEAFTYSVSHDLRAPLRSMEGFSEILLEDCSGKLDKKHKDYLGRISHASQQMSHLIDDLLKLSRLTRSEMHFNKVDLSRLVESIMEEFEQTNSGRSVEWVRAENIIVQGDEALLKVMLRNLIDNAWKFTSKKKKAKIEFGRKQEKGKSIYFIRDNGIGFDMKYVNKLFEAFQRQHIEFEGTGIGLTTVQRIVSRHGGRVWAEGKEDQGATFYFTLN